MIVKCDNCYRDYDDEKEENSAVLVVGIREVGQEDGSLALERFCDKMKICKTCVYEPESGWSDWGWETVASEKLGDPNPVTK